MLTMQVFYTRLFSAPEPNEAYMARLVRLTQANRTHMLVLDVGWQWWD
jgi:hypothetical protein